jgi:hypothetical protein
MLWWHRAVLRHRVEFTKTPSMVMWDGSVLPERTLADCSCGRVWVRRER